MRYHLTDEMNVDGVRSTCFRCSGKLQVIIRVIETERGLQMTKNRTTQCKNPECLQYSPVVPNGWIIDRPENHAKIKSKNEPAPARSDPFFDQRKRDRFARQSKAKAKNDWRSALVARGERLRALESSRTVKPIRLDEIQADVLDDDPQHWDEQDRKTIQHLERVKSKDVDTDSLDGT